MESRKSKTVTSIGDGVDRSVSRHSTPNEIRSWSVDVADHLKHGWIEVQPEVRPGSEVRDLLDWVVKDEGKEASNSPAVAVQLQAREFGRVLLREAQTVSGGRVIGLRSRGDGRHLHERRAGDEPAGEERSEERAEVGGR